MCERNLGKYTHPKLVKIMAKAEKIKQVVSRIELDQLVIGETGLISLTGLDQ